MAVPSQWRRPVFRGSGEVGRWWRAAGSADPAGVAVPELRAAAARAAALVAEFEGDAHRADEPGVDRQAHAVRRLVDARLEVLGETEGDAGGAAALFGLGDGGRPDAHRDLDRAHQRVPQAAL